MLWPCEFSYYGYYYLFSGITSPLVPSLGWEVDETFAFERFFSHDENCNNGTIQRREGKS
jgi:hypothetical protein